MLTLKGKAARSTPFAIFLLVLSMGLCSRLSSFARYHRHSYFQLHVSAIRRQSTFFSKLNTRLQSLKAAWGKVKPADATMGSSSSSSLPSSSSSTHNARDWLRLLKLARPDWKALAMGSMFLLLSSTASMIVPWSLGRFLDLASSSRQRQMSLDLDLDLEEEEPTAAPEPLRVSDGIPLSVDSHPSSAHPRLSWHLAGLALVFLLGAGANYGRVYIFRYASERIANRLRIELYSKLLGYNLTFFDRQRTGDLLSRLSSDTQLIAKAMTSASSDALRNIVQLGAGSALMLHLSPQLTGLILLTVPPLALSAAFYGRFVKRLSKETQAALATTLQTAEERLGNIRTVKAFSQESQESKLYTSQTFRVLALAKREATASASFMSGSGLAVQSALLLALWRAGDLVGTGELSLGSLSAFLMYAVYTGSGLAGLSSFYSDWMRGLAATSRAFEVLPFSAGESHDDLAKARLTKRVPPSPIHGKMELQHVSFTYPTRASGPPLFSDLNLVIEPGMVLAIVGPSGSGKSSLAALLLGLYEPASGNIRVDGRYDLNELDLEWWHSQISIVSQEPVLFATSIAENISYGNPHATMEAIEAAAREANAMDFIRALPQGLETHVGERGVALSGGQKQRIAIARACLRNPRILVLDEATSALDAESEALVQEALERLFQGRTVVTIAHRLSTIRNADQIAVLEGGKVKQMGTYAQLMAQGPDSLFYKLVYRQAKSLP